MPLATAAASPPLEPPVVRLTSQGLLVVPKMRLPVSHQRANSGRLVLAIITPPASRSRVTTVASLSGTLSAKMSEPPVVLMPAVSTQSLTVKGTPWSGPQDSPRIVAASACRARSIAPSIMVTMALSPGLRASMRSRQAVSTSTGEKRFFAYTLSQSARVEGQQVVAHGGLL